MSEESEFLKKLVESVADGDAVDWDALDELALDDQLRRLVAHLRLVSEVAEVHRSRVDDVGNTPAEPRTRAEAADHGARDTHAADPVPPPVRPPGTELAAASPGRDSERWGHLLLIRKIGEGAFGEVFLAHDPWLDHAVALKLLKKDVAGTLPTKILHEARKLARVRHANVVTVHGADRHDGRIGFWMDFVEGHTLADWLEAGRLSAGEATHVGQEVCRALTAVHKANIVHRDVKAQNVMRAADGGRIILMDFGAGEFIDDPLLVSREGTPLYLAPEVLGGASASVQSDIYALGVLLYHLVTGRYPVTGVSLADLTNAHRIGRRMHLSDERADLPDAFIATVERALDPDPARRFASAGQMYAALAGERLSGAFQTLPIIESTDHQPKASWQRSAAAAAGIAAATFLALTLVGFITSAGYYSAVGLTSPFYRESFLSWPMWGLRALLPGAVLVVAAASAASVFVTVLYRYVLMPFHATRHMIQPLAAKISTAAQHIRSSPASNTAPLVLTMQCVLVGLACWSFREILGGLDSLIAQTPGGNLTPLGLARHLEHQRYRQVFSAELFVFAAAWAGVVRAKYRRHERGAWMSIVGGAAMTMLTLILLVIPYRVLFHNEYERVSYQSHTCYLLGEQGREGLLFCPLQDPPRNRVISLDDPKLVRGGPIENVFAPVDSDVHP